MINKTTPGKSGYTSNALKYILTALIFSLAQMLPAQVIITGSTSVCAGEIAGYSVAAVTGSTYNWSITNGNITGNTNTNTVNIHWDTAGTGTVFISVTDINNMVTTGILNVTIHPKPKPHITWPAYPICPADSSGHQGGSVGQGNSVTCINVCKGATIVYSTSQHTGSTYQWTLTGAATFTGQGTNSVAVTWDTTSSGSVMVAETNVWGCVDSDQVCIKKVDVPEALFSTQSNVCLNTVSNFTNLSTGATSYVWYFGDGGSSGAVNPTHAYNTAGTYTITLIAMNACHCTDTFQSSIVVDSKPGPDIQCPSTVCAGDTQTYYTNAAGCVYNWIVSGGTIISGTGTSTITVAWGPGMIGHVSLYVTGCGSLCSDTTTVIVTIIPAIATISGPKKVCPGDCEQYSIPLFQGGVFTWSISGTGGGAITMQDCNEAKVCWPANYFSGDDTLNVSYYDTFLHCGGSGSIALHLRPHLSLITNAQACGNGQSNVSAFPGINCNWSISPPGPSFAGNGTSAIVINWGGVTGNYTVTAVPVNPNQVCNDSAKVKIKIVAAPPKPVITGDTIVCPNTAYSYCATGTNITWIVTGGTPVTGNSNCISITWGNTGPYLVQAIQQMAAAPNCPSDTAALAVQSALPLSLPNITGPGNVCANGTNTFTNTVIYSGFATLSWSISPTNSGSIVSGQGTNSVTIQWGNNAPSSATITLTVTLCSQTLTKSKTVGLFTAPNPSITVNGIFCPGTSVTLSTGVFISYQWSGPSFSSTSNPSSTVTLQGLYHLTVTDANGCSASVSKQLTHLPGPVASISTSDPTHYCLGTAFTVQLSALSNPNYTYSWSNGGTGNPHSVSTAGTYWVTVTDQNGCTSLSNLITITVDSCGTAGPCIPSGTVSFTHPAFYGCNPDSFANTSVNASSFSWDYGDGYGSNTLNGIHTYGTAGFYLVTLSGYVPNGTGTDSCLLKDTAHIEVPLAPEFKFTSGCAGDSVCFTDLSTFTPGNSITSWNWSFGDLSSSSSQSPCHKYAAGGTYIVTLTISNGTCSSSVSDTVRVLPKPIALFSFNSPSCINNNIPFTDLSTPASINYWSWTFGDGGTSLNQNPNHSYNTAASYPVQLIVRDTSGCRDTTTATVVIVAPNVSGNITAYPDTIVCAKTNVLLIAPVCTCTYLWNTGATNDSITVSATGIYSLTITDANGCKAVRLIHVLVNPGPSVSITNYGADKFCLGGNTSLSGFYSINYLYSWISNDLTNNGSVSSGIYVSPSAAGVYYYILAVKDTLTGCSDTSLPYFITVNDTPAAPVITAAGPTAVCEGDTITLVASHSDTSATIHWNTGLVGDTIRVTASGCYTADLIDSNGCDNSSTLCVIVHPAPDLCSFWTGCFDTCRPYVIHGPPGSASYQWLLNGVPIVGATAQNYTATLSGTYTLALTSAFGCKDTTGALNLTLHNCVDSTCAHLATDSVYCDEAGHYIFKYHFINHSGHNINQSNLLVLPPHLSTLYGPVTSNDTVLNGDTSAVHTATIYGMAAGTQLCFLVHVQQIDDSGIELFCCNTDTDCIILPPCDTTIPCCYLHILSDSVWCTGRDSAGLSTYGFSALVNGCGTLHLTTPDGTITTATNFNLTPGDSLITGSFTDNPPITGSFCLGFIMVNGPVPCLDTTICMTLPHCDTGCCYLHILSDSVWCKGVDTAGENIYGFKVLVNGCGQMVISTSDGTITSATNFNLTSGNTSITGTFTDNPPVTGSFCLNFIIVNGPVVCSDTDLCFHLPACDSVPVLPECYLQFPDSICKGQTATFMYTGSTAGHSFNWTFVGGIPSSATGPGPVSVTYSAAGCFPVKLVITTGHQKSVCYDSICVIAPPVASITQVGNTLYAYPAGMSYQWYVGPPNWLAVNGAVNQFYTPSQSTLFCVAVTNNLGCSDTVCKDFQFEGVDELSPEFKWSVVPNPNSGNFELLVQNPAGGKMDFIISNTIGQVMMHDEFETNGNETKKLAVAHYFAAGVYFIRLESETSSGVQKMVIK